MRKPAYRWGAGLVLVCGTLFAGPCGITTLQFQDFLTSSVIRTGVTSLAQIIEAAIIQDAVAGD